MRRPTAWLGAILLSGAWGFIDGFFVGPLPIAFWTILLAGAACLIIDAAGSPASTGGRLLDGLFDTLSIIALQLSLQAVLPIVMAHLHRIPGAAQAAVPLMEAMGRSAGADDAGNLLIETTTGVQSFAITWELAALPAMLRLLGAFVVLAIPRGFATSRGLAGPAKLLVILSAHAVLRLLVLLGLVASGARLSLCYEPAFTLVGLLPLAWLVPRWATGAPAGAPIGAPTGAPTGARTGGIVADSVRGAPRATRRLGRLALFPLTLAFAGACLGVRMGHSHPGVLKQGRVLIDESRSDWEWTDLPFDNCRYGQRSVYNYSVWRAWIEAHYTTRVTREPPDDADLREADVMIIKTPTRPYDRESLDRIERFVRQGGGLYLIGDHTNLFGMSTVLNQIAAPYGLEFQFDDTFPLDHEAYDIFRPGRLASPMLRGIASYAFETSCTLRIPWNARHVIIGRRLGADPVDYGHVNFFGNIRLDPSETFGLFVQTAGVVHGEGRVVAFTDSTNFSNFSMLWPGRRELTLNVIDWLNRSASPRERLFDSLVGLLGMGAAVLGAWMMARCGKAARAALLWVAVGSYTLASVEASGLTRQEFAAPSPRQRLVTVAFDTSLSSFGLEPASPILSRSDVLSWEGFNTFFINVARSSAWPFVPGGLAQALRTADAVVIVNPVRSASVTDLGAMSGFLRKGGRLLILDSILNDRSTAARIAGAFGMDLKTALLAQDNVAGRPIGPVLSIGTSKSTHRVVTRGGCVAVWREVGAGRIVVAGDAALLSDHAFGGVYVTPTEAQRESYRAEEELLGILLEPRGGEASR
ncbi:MAG TPA: DUF4350 domain-containing protein [Patescibacteria group bacterium]|nr:DUF4350 domain-containing protein [Patescibacteria group bacterium]